MGDGGRSQRPGPETGEAKRPSTTDPDALPTPTRDASELFGAGRFNFIRRERAAAGERIHRSLAGYGKAGGGRGERSAAIPQSGGAPLDGAMRSKMEGQLGAPLGGVNVYTGAQSAEAASQMGARAFTTGSDVHFGGGEFAPGTKEGDRLIAHELTHVVQGQRSGVHRKAETDSRAHPGGEHEVSQPGEPAEVEADSVADQVADKLHSDNGEQAKPDVGKRSAPAIGAKLEPGAIALAKKDDGKKGDKSTTPPDNRGRLQVQGKDLDPELSWPWAGKAPTAEDALAALNIMKSKLSKAQLAIRNEAFEMAAKFINQAKAGGGVDAPVSQSYQNKNLRPNEKTARVDVEVRTGKAFL